MVVMLLVVSELVIMLICMFCLVMVEKLFRFLLFGMK